MRKHLKLGALLVGLWLPAHSETFQLAYAPAPPDNPLKGFVRAPASPARSFPHSLEFDFLPLSTLMTGPDTYDWRRLDSFLDSAASRGNQGFFRIYLDYPGRISGIPQFLFDAGVQLKTFNGSGNTVGYSSGTTVRYPDYEEPRLRAALTSFIAALGKRCDGDPRIGFVEVGLLGPWGEWEMWAREGTFASPATQGEVLTAFTNAFHQTKLLARVPTTVNAALPIGYQEDSFGLRTMGNSADSFIGMLSRAGPSAMNKWRTQPIGGRINPDVDQAFWHEPPRVRPGQELDQCIAATHISWLISENLNLPVPTDGRRDSGVNWSTVPLTRARAMAVAQKLGYELQATQAEFTVSSNGLSANITLTNSGVAPFYYDWPVHIGLVDSQGKLQAEWTPQDWKLTAIQPEAPVMTWRYRSPPLPLPRGEYEVLIGVPNPLPQGKPLGFANVARDRTLSGWLTLGPIRME